MAGKRTRALGCSAALALLSALVLVTVAWTSWAVWTRVRGPTEPLWTMADLPASPPDDENGWALLRDGFPGGVLRERERQIVDDILDPQVSPSVRARRLRAAEEPLRRIRDRHREDIELGLRAIRKPRFADACPLTVYVDACPRLQLLEMHRLLIVDALVLADQGKLANALTRSAELLRSDLDHVASARTILAMLLGTLNRGQTVSLLEVLLELDPSGDPELAEPRRRILAELAHPIRAEAAQAVRGEYVRTRSQLDRLVAISEGRTSRLLIDRRVTSEVVDDHYSMLLAHVEDPARPPPEPAPIGEATPWWVYNPLGDLVIDTLLDLSDPFQRTNRQDAEHSRRLGPIRRALAR